MDGYRGEVVIDHPVFPEGSEATCGEAAGPVDISARDIVCVPFISAEFCSIVSARYTKADDDAIDAFHRDNSVYSPDIFVYPSDVR
jgi:alcohol oxidase